MTLPQSKASLDEIQHKPPEMCWMGRNSEGLPTALLTLFTKSRNRLHNRRFAITCSMFPKRRQRLVGRL